jgi:sec-independent protein translocase protein TatB
MIDLGWSKLIILAIIALVVVGPKELPALLRTVGRVLAELRRHAAEFKAQFDEAMKDTELDKIKEDVAEIKRSTEDTLRGIEQKMDQDLAEARQSVEAIEQGAPLAPSEGATVVVPSLEPAASTPSAASAPSPAELSTSAEPHHERVGAVEPSIAEPLPERARAGA